MNCHTCHFPNRETALFCWNCGTQIGMVCPACQSRVPVYSRYCDNCGKPLKSDVPSIRPAPVEQPGLTRPEPILSETVSQIIYPQLFQSQPELNRDASGQHKNSGEPPKPALQEMISDSDLLRQLKRLIPGEYADKLLAAQGRQTPGERRMVTILFSDVKGSTKLAGDLDPEETMEIMNGAFEFLISPIIKNEGTLARLMGDAILAFFGAPIAHEDDPVRAVRAALEIIAGAQEYARKLEAERGIVGFNVRVGINTGLVVVGEIGSDLRVEYTAMGDAINLAARMEQNAPVGGVMISNDTYQQTQGAFDMEALEPILVKGKDDPVQVYRVLKAKARSFRRAANGVAGVFTRMFGRDAEIAQMQDALRLAESGERQMLTIVGDPGVGKSRLLDEFENWVDLLPETVRYYKGRALAELQGAPYSLLRDMINYRFEIHDSDPVEMVQHKLETGFGEVLGNDEAGRTKTHILGALLGHNLVSSPYLHSIKDDSMELRDRGLSHLVEYFRSVSAIHPVLILLEDLHWADDSSLDAINRLGLESEGWRQLIVCVTRSAFLDRRPRWGEGQSFHSRIFLQPLSRLDSRRLADDMLQKIEAVPPELRDLVVNGSEGNPLYAEELVKMLIQSQVILTDRTPWQVDESRLAGLQVPPTLMGVLQARIDGLPAAERTALQWAAVVGRVFWDEALRYIVEHGKTPGAVATATQEPLAQSLESLRYHEMIFHREVSTFAETQEYIFKHAVLREVAYESVLKRARRAYHALAAEWLIDSSRDNGGEYAGLIAEHLERAGNEEQARVYLLRAAQAAAARYAQVETVTYTTRALALTPDSDLSGRWDLLSLREQALTMLGRHDDRQTDLETMEHLAIDLGDLHRQGLTCLNLSSFATACNKYTDAVAAANTAIEIARRSSDTCMEARAYLRLARIHQVQGQTLEAKSMAEKGLALIEGAQTPDREMLRTKADLLYVIGVSYQRMNEKTQPQLYFEQSLSTFRQAGDRRGEAFTLSTIGMLSSFQGDYAVARNYHEHALAIQRQIGSRQGESAALNNLGIEACRMGDYSTARSCYEQSLRICHEIADGYHVSLTQVNLGFVCVYQADYDAAQSFLETALQSSRENHHLETSGYALTGLGDALLGLDQIEQAEAAYREGVSIWDGMNRANMACESRAGLAAAALARNSRTDALGHANHLLSYLSDGTLEGAETPFLVYLRLFQALEANQDPRAIEVLKRAYDELQEQAARMDAQTRKAFLENVPWQSEIVLLWESKSELVS